MQDVVGSETTEEVEPTQQRIIHINALQPVKYCNNKVRSVINNKGYKFVFETVMYSEIKLDVNLMKNI
jgi:hypothetical protein